MPDLRALVIALGVGLGAGSYLTLFWHWPLALGGGVGIVLGGLALVGSVSIGPDPAAASAAWREAAPEFTDPPAGPLVSDASVAGWAPTAGETPASGEAQSQAAGSPDDTDPPRALDTRNGPR